MNGETWLAAAGLLVTFLGGGLAGSLLTYRVSMASHKFEREKYRDEKVKERRNELKTLYEDTYTYLETLSVLTQQARYIDADMFISDEAEALRVQALELALKWRTAGQEVLADAIQDASGTHLSTRVYIDIGGTDAPQVNETLESFIKQLRELQRLTTQVYTAVPSD